MTPLLPANIDKLWRHFEHLKPIKLYYFFNTAFHTANRVIINVINSFWHGIKKKREKKIKTLKKFY